MWWRTSSMPASRHSCCCRSSGFLAQKSLMLPPRKPPACAQPGEISRPHRGRTIRTYASQATAGDGCGRDGELERGDHPTRANDAGKFAKRFTGVVHVAEQVGERQPVEGRVGERELFCISTDERDARGNALCGFSQHFGALVEADDRAACTTRELSGDGARAGSHVQHGVLASSVEPGDEEGAPTGILAEREQPCVTVVSRAQWCKDLDRLAVSSRQVGHRAYVGYVDPPGRA